MAAMTSPTGVHPAADVFPMLDDDELADLAGDIETRGLINPIVLTPEGLVLDGRNRLAACALVGVEPTFIVYDGDPSAYVISANVHRRHLTTGQQAALTAKVLIAAGKRRNGRWVRGSVPAANGEISNSAWVKAMSEAGEVGDLDPAGLDLVAAGQLTLRYALVAARHPGVPEETEWRAIADASALDLADGDQALADRIVEVYVNVRRHYGHYLVSDIVDDLDYWAMTPKQRRDDQRAQRKKAREDAAAAEAARLAEWEALSDDDKSEVVKYCQARADERHLAVTRALGGPIDPDDEIRTLVAAIVTSIGEAKRAVSRLQIYTGLPEDEVRDQIAAQLLERKMPERGVELLWLLVDL